MRETTAFASWFAAHDATFFFGDSTVSVTSGFCPFFERLPEIGFVEIPERNVPTFALHSAPTRWSTARECATDPTVLGFVCRPCSATLPLAVYGCPRQRGADALYRWLPP